jgi:hypothetical protein
MILSLAAIRCMHDFCISTDRRKGTLQKVTCMMRESNIYMPSGIARGTVAVEYIAPEVRLRSGDGSCFPSRA